jgi:Zn-dependent protease
VFTEEVIKQLADAAESFAFGAAAECGFHMADGDVLEEAQRAAGDEQSAEFSQELFDEGNRKIVERQAGDDHVERPVLGKFFDTGVMERDAIGARFQYCIRLQPLTEAGHEVVIAFDEFEFVARPQCADDVTSDGTGTRADLQDAAADTVGVTSTFPHEVGERVTEGGAAGENGAGVFEGAAKFPQKHPIIGPLLSHRPHFRANRRGSIAEGKVRPRGPNTCGRTTYIIFGPRLPPLSPAGSYKLAMERLPAEYRAPTASGHAPDYFDDVELVPIEPPAPAPPRVLIPVLLFLATCVSTYYFVGPVYSAAIMTILLAHEFGHFLQARRYGVHASFPYFIPMPFSPIGTMGAVIAMPRGMGDRRALFDIGITGPIAGLIPSIIFSIIGLSMSQFQTIDAVPRDANVTHLGSPILFQVLSETVLGPRPEGASIDLHPLAYAGWVGIFLTALNLFPIGQLDGGHVLYALLLKKAHGVAQAMLTAVMFGVILWGYWNWSVMILLLMLMGPIHPPTANDQVPLGPVRTVLGWAALLFVPLGFTPVPFSF